MPRRSEGTTEDVRLRVTPDEAQMLRDIAAHLHQSQNKGARWALRYAWQHATSTIDHTACTAHSPCANATRGITPGKTNARPAGEPTSGQMAITHSATVEES